MGTWHYFFPILWMVFFGKLLRASDMEDPFILPIGTEYGDTFSSRQRCSLGVELQNTFRLEDQTIDKVYVCPDGVMMFSANTNYNIFDSWFPTQEFDNFDFPVVAPFLAAHGHEWRFLDEMCNYTIEENSLYAFSIHWCRQAFSEHFYEKTYYNYFGDESFVEMAKTMSDRNLGEIDAAALEELVRSDDETARAHFGLDTTKYPNLASHVMRREVTDAEDLEILNKLIRQKEGLPEDQSDLEEVFVDWAYVATWYKVPNEYNCDQTDGNVISDSPCFASFQFVLTCGPDRCFAIFNYFEVPDEASYYFQHYCGFFADHDLEGIPVQCQEADFNRLITGSNVGVKGVWVYELDQSGQSISPDDFQQVTSDNMLTVKDFNSYDDDEPFLLKFGPKKGDKFTPKTLKCAEGDYLSRTVKFKSYEANYLYVCQDGFVTLYGYPEFVFDVAENISSEPVIAVFLVQNEIRSNFLDFSCLLAAEAMYRHYFDDFCFQLMSQKMRQQTTPASAAYLDKYNTFAGNYFKREISSREGSTEIELNDMKTINDFINRRITTFEATIAYVTTWFKIAHFDLQQNSFQSIIACSESTKDCVIIMDYFELDWGDSNPGFGEMGKVWVTLKEYQMSRDELLFESNFGEAGIWVLYFPAEGGKPMNNFDEYQETDIEVSVNPDEPFILGFGPDQGDSISPAKDVGWLLTSEFRNGRVCSMPQVLTNSFDLSGVQIDWLFVCQNGVVELRSFNFTDNWGGDWPDVESMQYLIGFDEQDYSQNFDHQMNQQYFNAGLAFFGLRLNVFKTKRWDVINTGYEEKDILCSMAQDESEKSELYLQYLGLNFCPLNSIVDKQLEIDDLIDMRGWNDKESLQAVLELNLQRITNNDLSKDFRSDDELSMKFFKFPSGTDPEIVNLANNIFWRESTNLTDLQLVTEFINQKDGNQHFQTTWILVVTWYKVKSGTGYETMEILKQSFNSFQLILACGNSGASPDDLKCFAIFDYLELSEEKETSYFPKPGVFTEGMSGTKINVERQQLTSFSNYGVPGRWVFNLSNEIWDYSGIGEITPLDTSEDLQSARGSPFFLLPFGPNKGDKFVRKSDSRKTHPINLKYSQLMIHGHLHSTIHLETSGVLRTNLDTCEWDFGSHCMHPTFGIYDLEWVDTRDNFVDTMCSEFYLNLDQASGLYQWDIGEFCPVEIVNEKAKEFGYVYKRETVDADDLFVIDNLINRKIPSFQATSAYVVTWFKIQSNEGDGLFNTFQAIIACDKTNNDCVIIFNYHELEWGNDYEQYPGVGEPGKVWLTILEGQDQYTPLIREKLTQSSNFGEPGIWVIYLPGSGEVPLMNFEDATATTDPASSSSSTHSPPVDVSTSDGASVWDGNSNSNGILLLPFGRSYGDSFSPTRNLEQISESYSYYNYRPCSFPQVLQDSLVISGFSIDWLFVCLNGVIELRSFDFTGEWGESWENHESMYRHWWYPEYEVNQQYAEFGLKNFGLKLNVFRTDRWYLENQRNGQDGILCSLVRDDPETYRFYFNYLDPETCPYFSEDWPETYWKNQFSVKGLPNKDVLQAVLNIAFVKYEKDIDFQSDDEFSKIFFGIENEQESVNLANNIFTRETVDVDDLSLITDFIRTDSKNAEFQATWAAVVTWNTVLSPDHELSGVYGQFNSFQMTIACDSSTSASNDNKCLLIYDYSELQTIPAVQVGVYHHLISGEYVIATPSSETLTSSSNYGFPGRWVFDLSQSSWNDATLGDTTVFEDAKTIRGTQKFLLPFGPKHNDTFQRKVSYAESIYFYLENSEVMIAGRQYHSCNLAPTGVVFLGENPPCFYSMVDSPNFMDVVSDCSEPIFVIHGLPSLKLNDNIMDYMCSESYLSDKNYWTYWDINEFCPLLLYKNYESNNENEDDGKDSNVEDEEWHGWNLYLSVGWNSYASAGWDLYSSAGWNLYSSAGTEEPPLTEEMLDAIRSWYEELPTLQKEEVDIFTDDELARTIFGSDTTKYVNLAGNILKRETTDQSDLSTLTTFLAQFDAEFEASWAFVASWYKVPPEEGFQFDYNSYQAVITCDKNTEETTFDDVCYVIFDYFEVQWTGSQDTWGNVARCGVKGSKSNFVELPTSGTEEVRNLWADSVLGIPGMWLIKLSQEQDDFSIELVEAETSCDSSIEPYEIEMHDLNIEFILTGFICSKPMSAVLQIQCLFKGAQKEEIVPATVSDETAGVLTCTLGYWGEAEEVEVFAVVNGEIETASSKKVLFFSPTQLLNPMELFDFSFSASMGMEVFLGPLFALSVQQFGLFHLDVTCLFMEISGPVITTFSADETNDGHFYVPTFSIPLDSFSFAVCVGQTPQGKWHSDPVRGETPFTCEGWEELEQSRDLEKCERSLSRWYGCPRETSSGFWWWGTVEDQWYARMEVNDGVMGWEYDVCCNDQNLPETKTVSDKGYCSHCQFNDGADFCIKSIPVACKDGNTNEVHYVSNQCCYSEGKLIEEPGLGVGTMHLEESTLGNINDHSEADLLPFKACCLEDLGTEGCEKFYKYRPVVKGSYWSRVVRAARGDPHITTVDNATYTFNGLNVYTLILTSLSKPTIVQASTRVSGKGTLFSGMALKYDQTLFECYASKDGTFRVIVNKNEVELHKMKSFTVSNILITEDSEEGSFTFFFKDNDFIVKILQTDSFLHFFTSVPPTFNGKMKGLLGFYDGNPDNDYLAADGTEVSIDSDSSTIHNNFGETWKVEKSDWLFQFTDFVDEITADMEAGASYQASYEATFDDESLEQQAIEECKGDARCLLDVALTGDISVAAAFQRTEAQVTIFEVSNTIFVTNVPDQSEFQEEIEEANGDSSDPNNNSGTSNKGTTTSPPQKSCASSCMFSFNVIGWFIVVTSHLM